MIYLKKFFLNLICNFNFYFNIFCSLFIY